MLNSDSPIEVLGEAREGVSAVTKVAQLMPDVMILEVQMPGINGHEALKQIMIVSPRPRKN